MTCRLCLFTIRPNFPSIGTLVILSILVSLLTVVMSVTPFRDTQTGRPRHPSRYIYARHNTPLANLPGLSLHVVIVIPAILVSLIGLGLGLGLWGGLPDPNPNL